MNSDSMSDVVQSRLYARWAVTALFAILASTWLASCRREVKEPFVESTLAFIRNETDSMSGKAGVAMCDTLLQTELHLSVPTRTCMSHVADSLAYTYTSAQGVVLVRGRLVYIDAHDLRPQADALKREMTRLFGTSVFCANAINGDPFTRDFRFWRWSGHTVFFRVTVMNAPRRYPAVTVEIGGDDRTCDTFMGFPVRH